MEPCQCPFCEAVSIGGCCVQGQDSFGAHWCCMDFTLIHVYNSSHCWKKDQLLAGEKLKRRVYTQGYADIGWVFLAVVATTLGQLAPELLCYLLLCAGQAAQRASVAAGDASTPVDEDGEEPAGARNPTFLSCSRSSSSRSRTLSWWRFWRLWRVKCYMGFRSDQRLRRFFEENRAPCVPALPRWCWGLWVMGLPLGLGGLLVWLPLVLGWRLGLWARFQLWWLLVVGPGRGWPPLRPRVLVVVWFPPVGPQLVVPARARN